MLSLRSPNNKTNMECIHTQTSEYIYCIECQFCAHKIMRSEGSCLLMHMKNVHTILTNDLTFLFDLSGVSKHWLHLYHLQF